MRDQILGFLRAIDEALARETQPADRLDLYVIGRAALILFYNAGPASAVTRDIDVVQISWPIEPLLQRALELFGKDTQTVAAYGLYLEPVPSGLPPMPGAYRQRALLFEEGSWRVLRVHQLEIHDLAVSKLKRFAPKDREDLRDLCDRGLLQSERLKTVLESAFLFSLDKDGDEERDRAFAHLQRVVAYLEGEQPNL